MSSITSSSFWRRSRRVIQNNHKKKVVWQSVVMHSSLFSTCMSTVANHFEHAVRALAGAVFPLFGHVYAGMLFCFLSRLKFFYQPSLHAIAQESNHMTQPQRTHPTRAISANRTRARPVVDASQSRVIIFLKMSGGGRPTLISGVKDLREYL